jgi:L-ribulose-5-phosphate 3-epimerase
VGGERDENTKTEGDEKAKDGKINVNSASKKNPMYLGYNTNGFAHHELFDAVALLAEIGYRGVAITIDHGSLAPNDPNAKSQLVRLKKMLKDLGLRSVIETGARFLLDPRKKHEPTLLSASPKRRLDFYRYAIDCAAELGSDCVSIWSGVSPASVPRNITSGGQTFLSVPKRDPMSGGQTFLSVPQNHPTQEKQDRQECLSSCEEKNPALLWNQLVDGLQKTLEYAARQSPPVAIAFEPEPGMFIDVMAGYESLLRRIDAESDFKNFRLTLDIGHLQCQGETPIDAVVRRWASRLANVHIEDMRRGAHEHLMFGEGEIDFPPVLAALQSIGYAGGVFVELSRHSHMAPTAAQKAFDFLQPMID